MATKKKRKSKKQAFLDECVTVGDLVKELKKIDRRSDRLIAEYTAEYATLAGARARTMIDEALRIEEDRVKLKRRWLKRMEPVLPPRLLARYFQLENKFQAVVAADLARQIPLVP